MRLFRVPARWLIGSLTALTTATAAAIFGRGVFAQGWSLLSFLMFGLFTVLFFWIALSFWVATAGFVRCLVSRGKPDCGRASVEDPAAPLRARTAILMPIYNEDPRRVLAGLRATCESLRQTGHGAAFDFFLLSDTTNPDLWLAEEWSWARLNADLRGPSGLFYRHRAQNTGRKAGNIADFCERWGGRYEYMIVLDADSVMSGSTLVEMVRRMDADEELGILQAPPVPVNRVSLFARCQQFAARVYGPVFLEGYAWWSETDGNYWGHNAIIRVAPFTRHCGLSTLPGAAPLGGEILSHDFVEAALMRRAGLKVCLAQDLDGSYEESPPTLIDYAQRDQRWCQGNMQHIRLVFSYGLLPMSRLHLGMGAMTYLSSPLWLAFMILGILWAAPPGVFHPPANDERLVGWTGGLLLAMTMSILLLPKLWGYLLLLRDRRLAHCGGAVKAAMSVFIEALLSILVAPIMMAFHVVFVISTLLGVRVSWCAQERHERGQRFWPALATHWKQTVGGLLAAIAVWMLVPQLLPWLAPVLAGLILAIPLSIALSSVRIGQALARYGLLATTTETAPPPVLQRLRQLLAEPTPSELRAPRMLFGRLLADPAFAALHRCVLESTGAASPAEPKLVRRVEALVMAGKSNRISRNARRAIQSDLSALLRLPVAQALSPKT